MWTAFHPQTDGQSEISNTQVTKYLQAFTTHHLAGWDDMLLLAEYTYNASIHSSSKQSPFELDLEYAPSIELDFVAAEERRCRAWKAQSLSNYCELRSWMPRIAYERLKIVNQLKQV
jgi:hypothetical protein